MIARLPAHGIGHGAIAAVLLAALGSSCSRSVVAPPTSSHPLLQQPLPAFRRSALDGSTVDSKSFSGRVVVLELFSEHCVPCGASLPEAERAHLDRPAATFIGLSEDDDADGAARMVARHGLTFPVVHDAGRVLAGRLRLTELPSTVVVDGTGMVRWVGTRSFGSDELTSVIDQVASTVP